ncbi:hypothetical protein BFF78_36630 [Streptomyces fodineus]|uniref:SWIM-type domain-containing protein n=1 Tax=Streptomyces fodineus TaxID=1904616 RepID=A0A1D7YJT7_9ACTN|nr:hypothetical protein [Streptomyces fodineus]AOR35857.1 hypothetical protein BFF78_36630 [Streptomyces fodineus]
MSQDLPPVAPAVTAELVAALSPRLRKRLDAGIAKLADRPAVRDGDTVRISLDDDTDLELHAPDGTVTSPDAIRCGCLLAPDCLHRAAAASAAPIADDTNSEAAEGGSGQSSATAQTPTGPGTAGTAQKAAGQEAADAGQKAAGQETSGAGQKMAEPETADARQCGAAHALHSAAAAVLEAGADGAGAVLQAELLRAAHTARLAGLHRAAASAVSVVTALRAARAADPAYRLADLAAGLRDVLSVAHRVPHATGAELAALRGTARQPYRPDGSLRLYGLFSEPVLTASGYAGAVTWTADAQGRLYQVSDVAPGGAGRAVGAADRAVRLGDTALTHRQLSRAGLAVSGATVSPTGRLGAGAGVRAVGASGAGWREEPLDRLWTVPVAEQLTRALNGGHDLLFLEVTLLGTATEAAGDCLLAGCEDVVLRLTAAHDHPALPHRDNLRLLAAARGARLRIVARLTPAPLPRARLLATEHPARSGTRVDVGLDRLQRADLPTAPASLVRAAPNTEEAPVHLLSRRVQQAVSGGRRVLSFPGTASADARRLHRAGLATAGALLEELHAAAAERSRDVFGRLLPSDPERFARSWLAAARYTEEVDRALCAAAWPG